MPRNYFITGEPKAGKTTLLKDIVKELKKRGLKVGGFLSPDERHHGTRTAFFVMDVDSGKRALLASVDGDGPKISKYHVDIRSFESIALPAMERSAHYDVMVIDEIGLMELKSRRFSDMLDQLLESDTPLIATLHADRVGMYSVAGDVLQLDQSNRGQVFGTLLRRTARTLEKKPLKAEKKAPEKTSARPARKPARKATGKKPAKKAGKKPPKKTGKKAVGKAARKPARKVVRAARNELTLAPPPPAAKKVAMEEAALQEPPKEKPKEEHHGKKGLIHRLKKLLGS